VKDWVQAKCNRGVLVRKFLKEKGRGKLSLEKKREEGPRFRKGKKKNKQCERGKRGK